MVERLCRISAIAWITLGSFSWRAAEAADPPTRESILAGVKSPPGFNATLFAAPPDVRYPTCLSAAATGELFVGIDENGSLDAKTGRGRVVRCVDRDGDGQADIFTDFAEMDSPRGLVYDAGTLYVLHPPFITAYHDVDGDGRADRSEVLVEGLGFDLKFRGADHTTNGIRLGIDGWLYIAVGDYGFTEAKGKDGATRQLHGGGVARVRTDGTGLEVYTRGQRNIYDVAVDPYLNAFTRDNTNDGGGWDVRLSHIVPSGYYGYPSRFRNFSDEIVAPLADYGGGSPTGSIYLQEPGFPEGYGDTLYTCEWGRNAVMRHPLTPNGAGFKAGQETFVTIPRPTDIDVDGHGRIYISSWLGGQYTFAGPNVGYIVRVTAPGAPAPPFPDLESTPPAKVVERLAAPSQVLRLAAQREILRRGDKPEVVEDIHALALSDRPRAARVAALFTLAQMRGPRSIVTLVGYSKRPDLREFALRALADRTEAASDIPAEPFTSALNDPDPRVRIQAVSGLARLNKRRAAASIVPLTADHDPLVAHVAVNALVSLRAIDACLAAVSPTTPTFVPGAVRALQEMHETAVVAGLIDRLQIAKSDELRRPILKALCRLSRKEADWDGKWWTTRPDTSGPYYKPVAWDQTEEVNRVLRDALSNADAATVSFLLPELIKNKVEIDGLMERAVTLSAVDPSFRISAVDLFSNRTNLPAEAIAFLGDVAVSEKDAPALRALAIRGLQRARDQASARALMVRALSSVAAIQDPPQDLQEAWQAAVSDPRNLRNLSEFVKLAEGPDAAGGPFGYAVLLQADAMPRRRGFGNDLAKPALARAWEKPELATRLLHAIGMGRIEALAPQVRERLESKDPTLRSAAVDAARRLGIDRSGTGESAGPAIGKLPRKEVTAAVLNEKGDPELGAQLFQRQSCVNCHTVSKTESVKGPYLGDITTRYSRAELAEAILEPSAKIAQGFETQKIATKNGQTYEGFIVRESGEEVELRNSTGAVTVLPKAEIEERAKSEVSVMPTGLADLITVKELAAIISFLESLNAQRK